MSQRIKQIMKIFSSQKNKVSLASDTTGIFISRDLFLQNLKGNGQKDKVEIPTITAVG
jgi:hypothetical protein